MRWRQQISGWLLGRWSSILKRRTKFSLKLRLLTNTNPSAMMALWHIYKDGDILRRVRNELEGISPSMKGIDPKRLLKAPLLLSIYAETLRLYIKTYVMVSSPHSDVSLGKWRLPRGKLGLLNSGLSHMDEEFWNTKGGLHPVDSFWADRFLIYPSDSSSGPINPALRTGQRSDRAPNQGVYYSTEGIEASWFPYGGES